MKIPSINSRNKYWDKRFERGAIYGENPSAIIKKMLKYLKGPKVLVAGGGYGRNSAFLADKGFNIVNFDISKNALNLGKNVYKDRKNLKFLKGDITVANKLRNGFDSIICLYILSLLNDKEVEKAINNFKNILVPNGKLICNFLSNKDAEYGLGRQIGKNKFVLDNGEQFCKFYTKKEAVKLLKSLKFKIIDIFEEKEKRFISVLNKNIISKSWVVICENR